MINGNSSWKANRFSIYPICSFEIEKARTKENSKKAPLRKLGWSFGILSDLAIKPNPREEVKLNRAVYVCLKQARSYAQSCAQTCQD